MTMGMVYPRTRLLWLAAVVIALALAVSALPSLSLVWKLAVALLLGAALADLLLGVASPDVRVTRAVDPGLPVGLWSKGVIEVENPGSRALTLTLHDHVPEHFESMDMPARLRLPPRQAARVTYRVRPLKRGRAVMPGMDLLVGSPLGMWERKRFVHCRDEVRVFPNFREIARYALLATENRLSRMGVKRRLRRGEGSDFHQLREFRPGDTLRQVEWKATSRLRKPISKEYQDERDQQILFLLDCGRRMRHADDDRIHLDEALNAMLLLCHVAQRQGDATGFLAFGGPHRWMPPLKGAAAVRELLDRTFDLEATAEAADYLAAARELMTLQRRRALVVVLTNARDEDQEDLRDAVRLLRRQHLVVVANLREQVLDDALTHPITGLDSALRFQGIAEYLESRRRSHETLQHLGAMTLDLLASQLPVALVNRYLDIKAAGTF